MISNEFGDELIMLGKNRRGDCVVVPKVPPYRRYAVGINRLRSEGGHA